MKIKENAELTTLLKKWFKRETTRKLHIADDPSYVLLALIYNEEEAYLKFLNDLELDSEKKEALGQFVKDYTDTLRQGYIRQLLPILKKYQYNIGEMIKWKKQAPDFLYNQKAFMIDQSTDPGHQFCFAYISLYRKGWLAKLFDWRHLGNLSFILNVLEEATLLFGINSDELRNTFQKDVEDYFPSLLNQDQYLFQDLSAIDLNSLFVFCLREIVQVVIRDMLTTEWNRLSVQYTTPAWHNYIEKHEKISLLQEILLKLRLFDISNGLSNGRIILDTYRSFCWKRYLPSYNVGHRRKYIDELSEREKCDIATHDILSWVREKSSNIILSNLLQKLNFFTGNPHIIEDFFSKSFSDATKVRVFGVLYAFLEDSNKNSDLKDTFYFPSFQKEFSRILLKNLGRFLEILGICKVSGDQKRSQTSYALWLPELVMEKIGGYVLADYFNPKYTNCKSVFSWFDFKYTSGPTNNEIRKLADKLWDDPSITQGR